MQGRLYTAHEIFEAIKEATVKAAEKMDEEDFFAQIAVTRIGADIAYDVANTLEFDMKQLEKYCKGKVEENDGED